MYKKKDGPAFITIKKKNLPEVKKPYQLSIGFQSTVGGGFLDRGSLALCVLDRERLKEAIEYAFTSMIKRMNDNLRKHNGRYKTFFVPEKYLGKIMRYVARDLADGKVLQRTIAAGQIADATLGM